MFLSCQIITTFANFTACRGSGVCLLIKESMNFELQNVYCLASDVYEVINARAEQIIVAVRDIPSEGNSKSLLF